MTTQIISLRGKTSGLLLMLAAKSHVIQRTWSKKAKTPIVAAKKQGTEVMGCETMQEALAYVGEGRVQGIALSDEDKLLLTYKNL